MNWLVTLGSLAGILLLGLIAWALGLGRREPLTADEVAERIQFEHAPITLRALLMSLDGRTALAFANDGRVIAIKAHGSDLATRLLTRPLKVSEDGSTLILDTRDRWFGPLRLRLGPAQLPSARSML